MTQLIEIYIFTGQSEQFQCGAGVDCSQICSSSFDETEVEACLKIVVEDEVDDQDHSQCGSNTCNPNEYYPPDIGSSAPDRY